MTLRYNVGDTVVLGDSVDVDVYKIFTPGKQVCIMSRCMNGAYQVNLNTTTWWIMDREIDHEATASLALDKEGVNMTKSYFVIYGDYRGELAVANYPDKEALIAVLEDGMYSEEEYVKVIFGEEVKVKTKYILCEGE